jgi:hypothetical protein
MKPYLVRVILFDLALLLISFIGFFVFFLGIYAYLIFWAGKYFILDEGCSFSESFEKSRSLTKGHRLYLALFFLGLLAVSLIISQIPGFIIFSVVTAPLLFILTTYLYLWLKQNPKNKEDVQVISEEIV